MEYAGRPARYWRTLLSHERLSLRWMAVRALSQLEPEALLLHGRSPQVAWALAPSSLPLDGFPLARLMRQGTRPGRPRSRAALAARVRASQGELAAFAWCDQLVRQHGAHAIPGLIDLLGTHPEPAAWALSRLGRVALPECLDAARQAAPSRRRRFCRFFWYLGREARGAETLLAGWLPDPEAEAALLALEEFGAPALIEQLGGPVWLDQPSVDALAQIIFGEDRSRAVQAVRALGWFGPACASACRLLRAVEREPVLGEAAQAALVAHGDLDALARSGHLTPEFWLPFLEDVDPNLQTAALEHVIPHQVPTRLYPEIVSWALGSNLERARAAARFLTMVPAAHGAWVEKLLGSPDPELRCLALGMWHEPDSLLAALDHPETGLAAARRLLELGQVGPELLCHPDPRIRALSAPRAPELVVELAREQIFPEWAELVPVDLLEAALIRAAPGQTGWLVERLARAWGGQSLLSHPEPRVRRLGARVVLLSGQDPPSLEGETSWSVRALLEEARRRRDDGFEHLQGWLRGSPRLALEALDRLPASELAGGVQVALEHRSARVRARAGELALEHHLDLDPVWLEDPDASVRRASFRVLAARASEDLSAVMALALIAEGWKDPDPGVRSICVAGLRAARYLPPDLLREGTRFSPEAVELLQALAPEDRFARLLSAALAHLEPPEQEEWALFLGRRNLLDHLPLDLLARALPVAPRAIDWLAARPLPDLPETLRLVLSSAGEVEVLLYRAFFLSSAQSAEPAVATGALAALARALPGPKLLPALELASRHNSPMVRREAAAGLRRHDLGEPARALLESLSQDPDEGVRREAELTRVRLGSPGQDIPPLGELLGSPSADIRCDVAAHILRGAPWCEELLARGLQDEDPRVRLRFSQTVQVLGLFLPEALPVFLEQRGYDPMPPLRSAGLPLTALHLCRDHPDELVRRRAAELLGLCSEREALKALEKLALDDSPAVRDAAHDALLKLLQQP